MAFRLNTRKNLDGVHVLKRLFSQRTSIVGLLIALSALWLAFIVRFGNAHLTLNTGWADNVSHLYTTWIFWDHGTRIIQEPLKNFVTPLPESERQSLATQTGLPQDDFHLYLSSVGERLPIFGVWMDVPRPYPPALYVVMSPFSYVLKYTGNLRLTLIFWISLWLLIAHLAAWLFFEELCRSSDSSTRAGIFVLGLFSFIAYFEFVRWTLNAQYDVLPVLFAILAVRAYRQAKHGCAQIWLAIAFGLHMRALFLAPLGVVAFFNWVKQPEKNLKNAAFASPLIVVLFGSFALSLIWNQPYFKMAELYDLNPINVHKLGAGNWGRTLVLALGLFAITGYWIFRRRYLALACGWTVIILMTQSRLMREWYVLFLFPIALLAISDRTERARREILIGALAFYVFIASVVMNNSPFELRLLRQVLESKPWHF